MNRNVIKYPIGIQTFEEIIKSGYLYVDKTDLVYQLTRDNKYVFLSRPRRFGKTLLISTLEAYYRGRKELFKGLAIETLEETWEILPVLRLDLSMDSFETVEKLDGYLSVKLDYLEEEYGIEVSGVYSPAQRFERLIRTASQTTGKKVVILVDEYDKPIVDALEKPELQSEIRQRLQGFYSVIKGSDPYIHFAMLTGVGKFAHLSIFSGLNNLNDVSLDEPYNAICGISESQIHRYFPESVKDFAEVNGISQEETWQRFKTQYDGYHFCVGGEDIYNPFSVLKAFSKQRIDDYWFRSGTPSFLVKLVRRNEIELGVLENATATGSQLNNITDTTNSLVPLLYQSGYLTIKGWKEDSGEYQLGFPNEEVRRGFWDYFVNAYFPSVTGNGVFSLKAFVDDLNSGNARQFMERLQSLISDTSSETERNKEIHFQNIMAIIGKMLGFRVQTEVHSALGRCDMILKTADYIYIFEYKLDKGSEAVALRQPGSAAQTQSEAAIAQSEAVMGQTKSEEAIAQIKRLGYANPYKADKRTKILIGATFSTKTRSLTDWVIERT